ERLAARARVPSTPRMVAERWTSCASSCRARRCGAGMRNLGLALLCLLALPAAASAFDFNGTPTGVFRTATLDHGEWIYTNGLHQARGANTDGLHRTDYFKATDPQGDDPTHINRDLHNALTYDFFGPH